MQWPKIRIVPLIIFLIFILLIGEWFEYMHSLMPLMPVSSHHPDSFMTGVTAIQYNKKGQLHYRLMADKISSYSNPPLIKAIKPFYTFKDKTQVPWTIQADSGISYDNMNKIVLKNHVLIKQLPGVHSHQFTLSTRELTLYPNRSLAETDKPVTIIQPNHIIHSIGLRADLNKGTIQLLSDNQGEYLPKS